MTILKLKHKSKTEIESEPQKRKLQRRKSDKHNKPGQTKKARRESLQAL